MCDKLNELDDIIYNIEKNIDVLYIKLNMENKFNKEVIDIIIDKNEITRYTNALPQKLLYDEKFLFEFLKDKDPRILSDFEEPLKITLNKNNFNKFIEIMKNNLYRKQIRMFNLDIEINNRTVLEYLNDTNLKNKIRRYLNKK